MSTWKGDEGREKEPTELEARTEGLSLAWGPSRTRLNADIVVGWAIRAPGTLWGRKAETSHVINKQQTLPGPPAVDRHASRESCL